MQPTSYQESSRRQEADQFLLEESQNLYEDFAILNDPIALEQTLKDQYEKSKTNRWQVG